MCDAIVQDFTTLNIQPRINVLKDFAEKNVNYCVVNPLVGCVIKLAARAADESENDKLNFIFNICVGWTRRAAAMYKINILKCSININLVKKICLRIIV